ACSTVEAQRSFTSRWLSRCAANMSRARRSAKICQSESRESRRAARALRRLGVLDESGIVTPLLSRVRGAVKRAPFCLPALQRRAGRIDGTWFKTIRPHDQV